MEAKHHRGCFERSSGGERRRGPEYLPGAERVERDRFTEQQPAGIGQHVVEGVAVGQRGTDGVRDRYQATLRRPVEGWCPDTEPRVR